MRSFLVSLSIFSNRLKLKTCLSSLISNDPRWWTFRLHESPTRVTQHPILSAKRFLVPRYFTNSQLCGDLSESNESNKPLVFPQILRHQYRNESTTPRYGMYYLQEEREEVQQRASQLLNLHGKGYRLRRLYLSVVWGGIEGETGW